MPLHQSPRVARVAVVAGTTHLLLVHSAKRQLWQLPGGRIRARENVRSAASREVAEETGLCIKPKLLTTLSCAPLISHSGAVEEVHYFAAGTRHRRTRLTPQDPSEIDAVAWFTLSESIDLTLTTTTRHLLQSIWLVPFFLAL